MADSGATEFTQYFLLDALGTKPLRGLLKYEFTAPGKPIVVELQQWNGL